MEENEHIWQHIVKYLMEGTPSTYDPVLKEWLEDESNRSDFLKYCKIWESLGRQSSIKQFEASVAWEKVDKANSRVILFRQRLKYAACLVAGVAASVIVMLLAGYYNYFGQPPAMASMEVKTAYGSRSEVVLPDGSKVMLNAGSQLNYYADGVNNMREVNFRGEGFFEVEKADIPFVITTSSGMQVKVLGTTFNLSAYEDDATVVAGLVEGNLELDGAGKKLTLVAGQMGQYSKPDSTMMYIDGELSFMYGWLQNKLYMESMSLADVCKRLERWYDVKITLEGGIGQEIHYSGVLKEKTIMDVLESLCQLSKIKYRMKEKNIVISPK